MGSRKLPTLDASDILMKMVLDFIFSIIFDFLGIFTLQILINQNFDIFFFQMSTLNKVQEAIKNSEDGQKLVELNLSEIQIEKFTPEIKKAIEKCTNLEILILTACQLKSLDNMPDCDLTAIDLSGNKLGDSELVKLARYPNLGQLILNENNITKLDSIKVLSKLEHLQELDFSENPVTKEENYRDFVFENLTNLEILDRFDREGNEQIEEGEFEDDEDDEEGDFDDEDDQDEDDFDEDEESQSPVPKKKR